MSDVTTTDPEPDEVDETPEPPQPITPIMLRQTALNKANELVQQIAYPSNEAETKRIEQAANTAATLHQMANHIEFSLRNRAGANTNKISVGESGNAAPQAKAKKKAKKAK